MASVCVAGLQMLLVHSLAAVPAHNHAYNNLRAKINSIFVNKIKKISALFARDAILFLFDAVRTTPTAMIQPRARCVHELRGVGQATGYQLRINLIRELPHPLQNQPKISSGWHTRDYHGNGNASVSWTASRIFNARRWVLCGLGRDY